MLTRLFRHVARTPQHQYWSRLSLLHTSRPIKARAPESLRKLDSLSTPADHAQARSWLGGYVKDDIPKEACKVSYSRSSGPGGQHVNKTNSKATVKCDLVKAGIPDFIIASLQRSPYYLPSPPSLQISSQATRTASSNLDQAMGILHDAIVKAAQSMIVGETSDAQRAKVRGLARAEEGRRRDMKDKRSSKKSARKDW